MSEKRRKKYSGSLLLDKDELDGFFDDEFRPSKTMNSLKKYTSGLVTDKNKCRNKIQSLKFNSIDVNHQNYYPRSKSYFLDTFQMVSYWIYPQQLSLPHENTVSFGNGLLKNSNRNLLLNIFCQIPVQEIKQNLHQFLFEQKKCKLLQQRLILETNRQNYTLIDTIFPIIKNNFLEYSLDQFGNYFCQKLIEKCSNKQLETLLDCALDNFKKLALSPQGTRVLQTMIKKVRNDQMEQQLINQLEKDIGLYLLNQNSSHIIQNCFDFTNRERCQFIVERVCTDSKRVTTHKFGCCVAQKILEFGLEYQQIQIAESVMEFSDILIQDKYGNYVIQAILGDEEKFKVQIEDLGKSISINIIKYCNGKESSNIVEKCIRVNVEIVVGALVKGLSDPGNLQKVIQNKYGNYVLQTFLIAFKLSNMIKPILELIKRDWGKISSSKTGYLVLMNLERNFNFWNNPKILVIKNRRRQTPRSRKYHFKK